MATPAEIRANYYRSKRRSPEAQAIAERLEEAPRRSIGESSRVSKFNEGRDPFLNTLSDASAALAPGGFSSVDMNLDTRRDAVRAGVEAEIPDWLPTEVQGRLRERQDAMGRKLTEREKEQAEYERMAGVPNRVLLPGEDDGTLVSSATKREQQETERRTEADEALKAKGITAESYWSEDPTKKDSFVREVITPEGDVITQRTGPEGISSVTAPRMVEQRAMDEDAAIKRSAVVGGVEKKRSEANKEGEKREGAKAANLFASWDANKEALAEGIRFKKDAERRLRDVRRMLDKGDTLTAEAFNELVDEEALLRGVVGLREEGLSKEVTKLGRDLEKNRRTRKGENEQLRAAALRRALAADTEAGGVEKSKAIVNEFNLPFSNILRSFSNLSGFSSGFAGF